MSVITVTYQSRSHIDACLNSVLSTAGDWLADGVVVDNASADGSADHVRATWPWALVIQNDRNLGYGRAMNQAAGRTTGEYLLIMNPDVVLRPGAVEELAGFLDHRPEAAACGPMLLSPEGEFRFESRRKFPTPWNSLGYFLGLSRLFPDSRLLGEYHSRWLSPDLEVVTDSLSGSCMMVRKDAFLKIGGFDEDYFLFGEDIDLCWKLKQAGQEIWYVPAAVVAHAKGASMKHDRPRARLEFYRSMRIFIDKRLVGRYPRPLIWAMRLGVGMAAALSGKYRR
ncbi:MAG: glycosyltransferase family 2 protein [bacterium]|nr:glycosyltransferase family 2 protein [bacterium]